MRYRTPIILLSILLSQLGIAAEVIESDGNIYLKSEEQSIQITTSGKDEYPTLSPDQQWIAFVRTNHSNEIAAEVYESSIFLVSAAGGTPRELIRAGAACGQNEFLGNFNSLAFFSDSERLAFQSSWVYVHGSTHTINTKNGTCTLTTGGNSLYVVRKGKYRDHLIVWLHKYFIAGGAYDWFWLVDSTGKEIGPIGPAGDDEALSLELFREQYEDESP